jgi:hypothetical protein
MRGLPISARIVVIRGKIELPTFRFSGVLSFLNPNYQGGQSAQLTRIDAGHWACMPILAIVPPCAGECRLVRVTGVLIFANSRTCVACVLPAAGPPAIAPARASGLAAWRARRRVAATTHRPVGRPVAPGAIAGMTLRNEQSVRPTPQTTHNDSVPSTEL